LSAFWNLTERELMPETLNPSIAQIEAVLSVHRFDQLIGFCEGSNFEAKSTANAYDFSCPSSRYELAKDVSSFANAEGGYIIFGLAHEKYQTGLTEIVTALNLFSETSFQKRTIEGIITTYIHPRIKGIQVRWIQDAEGELGLGCIFIPSQPDGDKYYLINSVYDEGIVRNIVFGLAIRKEAASVPMAINEIYRKVRGARRSVPETLDRIETQLTRILHRVNAPPNTPAPSSRLEARIRSLLDG